MEGGKDVGNERVGYMEEGNIKKKQVVKRFGDPPCQKLTK